MHETEAPTGASAQVCCSGCSLDEASPATRARRLNQYSNVARDFGVGVSDEISPSSFGPAGGCEHAFVPDSPRVFAALFPKIPPRLKLV